ncbi:MAG: VOC family protein [Gemmatimonadetes bacterium]|nr:VOC family protein [Gemmatimonadota bacterium]
MLQPLRTVIVHADEPFSVGFNIGGTELGLDPDPAVGAAGTEAAGAGAAGTEAAGAGGTTAYWRVRDADQAHAHLLSIGGVSRQAVHDVGGGILAAAVLDPFGNTIGVIEIPGERGTPPLDDA